MPRSPAKRKTTPSKVEDHGNAAGPSADARIRRSGDQRPTPFQGHHPSLEHRALANQRIPRAAGDER